MKHTRIIVTRHGGPEVLPVLEEQCPEPKDGEVRVRVLAAGVSSPDLMMREGVHPETSIERPGSRAAAAGALALALFPGPGDAHRPVRVRGRRRQRREASGTLCDAAS